MSSAPIGVSGMPITSVSHSFAGKIGTNGRWVIHILFANADLNSCPCQHLTLHLHRIEKNMEH